MSEPEAVILTNICCVSQNKVSQICFERHLGEIISFMGELFDVQLIFWIMRKPYSLEALLRASDPQKGQFMFIV